MKKTMKNQSLPLSREEFKKQVFDRSKGKCVFCNLPAIDAHHILDRKLWRDGGYYLDNGAAVCEQHHWDCEKTIISVEKVRECSGITQILLPEHLDQFIIYDKWGNTVIDDNWVKPGVLWDQTIAKLLIQSGKHALITYG